MVTHDGAKKRAVKKMALIVAGSLSFIPGRFMFEFFFG